MVLLVGNSKFSLTDEGPAALKRLQRSMFKNIFDAYTGLTRASDFGNTEVIRINSSNEILYVHQSEMAVVKYGADDRLDGALPRYAGTSEMTSCQAVVLTSSTGYALGHLDGSYGGRLTEEFFYVSTGNLEKDIGEIFDVHIVGGFLDGRGYSADLTVQIITYLLTSLRTFRLKTLFCYSLNDRLVTYSNKQLHEPIVRAVAFDTRTGIISPACINPRARGPLSVLRSTYVYSTSSPYSMHSIIDPISHILRIKPFAITQSTMRALSGRESKTNEELAWCSTTPQQETSHFYDMLRRTSSLMASLMQGKTDFFSEGNLEFAFDAESKQWTPLNSQTEAVLKHPLTSF
ncbi:hypothetical protein Aperf_G00000096993 [Anoplocephala perfoliata]